MCGIIWAKLLTDSPKVKKTILKQFEWQRTRGVQGFGFLVLDKDKKITDWFQSQTEAQMKVQMQNATAPEILFHHRYPTSTPNVPEATHPIRVSHASLKHDYYVVHNGIISNANDLYTKYTSQGFEYTTKVSTQYRAGENVYTATTQFNDSESLAIDLALSIESASANLESRGSIAFIAIQVNKQTQEAIKLFFGRNYQNPLDLLVTGHKIMLASDLRDAGSQIVDAHTLFAFDYATRKVEKVRDLAVGEKSSYDYNKKGANTGTSSTTGQITTKVDIYRGNKGKTLTAREVEDFEEDEKAFNKAFGTGRWDDKTRTTAKAAADAYKEDRIVVYEKDFDNQSWTLVNYDTREEFDEAYWFLAEQIEQFKDYLDDPSLEADVRSNYQDWFDHLETQMDEYDKVYKELQYD